MDNVQPDPGTAPTLSDADVVDAIEHVLEREGRVHFRAHGGSMMPAVWPGCPLAVDRCDAGQLEQGDLALVRTGDRLILHRVVAIYSGTVVTQGDAHTHSESVEGSQVLGRVPGVVVGRRHWPNFPRPVRTRARAVYLRTLPWLRAAMGPALRHYRSVRLR